MCICIPAITQVTMAQGSNVHKQSAARLVVNSNDRVRSGNGAALEGPSNVDGANTKTMRDRMAADLIATFVDPDLSEGLALCAFFVVRPTSCQEAPGSCQARVNPNSRSDGISMVGFQSPWCK